LVVEPGSPGITVFVFVVSSVFVFVVISALGVPGIILSIIVVVLVVYMYSPLVVLFLFGIPTASSDVISYPSDSVGFSSLLALLVDLTHFPLTLGI